MSEKLIDRSVFMTEIQCICNKRKTMRMVVKMSNEKSSRKGERRTETDRYEIMMMNGMDMRVIIEFGANLNQKMSRVISSKQKTVRLR